ncbi:hypothetical protein BIZ35_02625 [Heyndrickxia coagulans]|jgi:hypothetical protein|nr:hypothetical protein BIZ35_02625 [Heyndrickxia coagulans]KGT38933.1 hypothetical protein P421_07330 [Heyndrickxia coagulans P38]KYC61582.1 hypothetical protein B4100_0083 [Heyndrickxia coagulans]KYC70451.1 hypothetical protein B4096_0031 [Heyndrickxia coagulans]
MKTCSTGFFNGFQPIAGAGFSLAKTVCCCMILLLLEIVFLQTSLACGNAITNKDAGRLLEDA